MDLPLLLWSPCLPVSTLRSAPVHACVLQEKEVLQNFSAMWVDNLLTRVQRVIAAAAGGAVTIDGALLGELQTQLAALMAEWEAARAAGAPGAQLRALHERVLPAAALLAGALLSADLSVLPEARAKQALELACAVAARRGCNNLRCSEYSSARRCKKCSGCRVAWFCGPACQKAAWQAGHKHVCAQLAAAAGSPSAAAD